jgi:polyferredoxin
MKIKRSTRVVQLISLGLFLILLGFATYPLVLPIPADLVLRLDPLIALGTLLAAHRLALGLLITSLVLLIATVWLGRFFCSHVCPMGTTLDLLDEGITARYRKRREGGTASRSSWLRWKYYILAGVLLSCLAGTTFLFIFDPISLATRFYTLVIYPIVVAGINGVLLLFRPLLSGAGSSLAYARVGPAEFSMMLLTLLMVVGIAVLQLSDRRFWCRYLCPLGALLAWVARVRVLRRTVSEDCTDCGLCREACLAGALAADARSTVAGECFVCQSCADACSKDAVTFAHSGWGRGGGEERVDVARRGVLAAGIGGIALGAMGGHALAEPGRARLVRPPGALPEDLFLETCVRCGECMKACLTNTLQPCFLESGWEGVWTPRLNCRHAGCEERCNVCGHVCPTQAIRALSLKEKQYAKIGTAVIDRARCIAWEQNKECLICDEACPYNAIDFRMVMNECGTGKRPFVEEITCTGCGLCEQKCPVGGDSAIIVHADGEVRKVRGTYITEEVERARQPESDRDRDYFAPVQGSSECLVPAEPVEEDLPPGFLMGE